MGRLEEIEQGLARLNRGTADLFSKTVTEMEPWLDTRDLIAWGELCYDIAASGWHAWESSGVYQRISPALIQRYGPSELFRCGQYGAGLCGFSHEPGMTYFSGLGGLVRSDNLDALIPIERAGALVKDRYPHASSLISDFFRAACTVAENSPLDETTHWNAIAADMSGGVRAEFASFLTASKEVDTVSWAFVRRLHELSPTTSLSYLTRYGTLRNHLDAGTCETLSPILEKYALAQGVDEWLDTLTEVLPGLHKAERRHLVLLFNEIPGPGLAACLCRSVDQLPMGKLDLLRQWITPAIARAPFNFEAAAAFLSLESSSSQEWLETLLGQVRFSDCRRLFQLYAEGMTGQKLGIEAVSAPVDNFRDLPGTDGRTVYLPEIVGEYPDSADNFRWYKVSLLHQLGYYEFGTFSNPDLVFATYFQQFPDPKLAATLFQILEDARVDWQLERRYRGAAEDIRRLKADTLKMRVRLAPLTPRGQLLEAMLRYSLDGKEFDFVRSENQGVLSDLIAEISHLKQDASLSDTLAVLASCYELIGPYAARQDEQEQPEWLDTTEAEPDESQPEAVSFRGKLDPDQVSLNIDTMETEELEAVADGEESPLPGSTVDPKNIELQQFRRGEVNQEGMVLTDAEGPVAQGEEADETLDDDGVSAEEVLESPTDRPMEDRVWQYDEWDFVIDDYRRRWCTLFEIRESEHRPEFVDDTLKEYRSVALGVRRQLNMLKPQLLRKVKGVTDGEELDLERAVEAVVDRKSGFTPGDRIYVQRQRKERDVSALFLLDMSASTDDAIPDPEAEPVADAPAPLDEDDFLTHFYGTEQTSSAPKQRIIDVEKQAVVLMAEALKDLGDSYSICGFSGYGRDRVDFFLCKDFDEPFNQRVKGRIGAIKPCRSTRMGPAIRHATYNLCQTESKIQALIIISDGYPQDFDYGKDRNSKDYGIRDTTKALAEARQQGVQTFCLTVDPSGHDYLREMCPDQQYMVIQEISQLPNELSKVYRALTG